MGKVFHCFVSPWFGTCFDVLRTPLWGLGSRAELLSKFSLIPLVIPTGITRFEGRSLRERDLVSLLGASTLICAAVAQTLSFGDPVGVLL